MPENKNELSIGEVSNATGISVYTLRQWERRYGYPKSIKRISGHRRYYLSEVKRLRLVALVIALGKKTKTVVGLEYNELIQMLSEIDSESPILSIEKWLSCAKNWEQNKLLNLCYSDWEKLEPLDFLNLRVVPFLVRIGESWMLNEISIAQEHFFSELLQSFLAEKWRELNAVSSKELYVLATPEGEEHCLGLHMCALVLALHKRKVLFLGGSTPYGDIILASKSTSAHAVCLSFSANYVSSEFVLEMLSLKSKLGPSQLIVGGEGAYSKIDGVHRFNNFNEFSDWLNPCAVKKL